MVGAVAAVAAVAAVSAEIAERALDVAREATRGVTDVNLTNDAEVVLAHPDIDIVVELIGGIEPAKTFVLKAIANGKHVVTANKALLARHGTEIFAAAHAKGVMVAFEGAVAGGIPIVKALREGLTANRLEWIAGIINGTSNFILSEMRARGAPFAEVLKEAQSRGYAEADPTFDIEGIDAAHKPVSYTHLRAHETVLDLVCRLLLENTKKQLLLIANTHRLTAEDIDIPNCKTPSTRTSENNTSVQQHSATSRI